jgi:ureidoacrylate peracid hydrolase
MLDVTVDPRDTALLVIDMQNGFCHPEGAMAKVGIDISRQQAVVPAVGQLVRLCHAAGLPVLWSKQVHFEDDRTRKNHKIPTHQDKRSSYPCRRGTWDAELVDELAKEVSPEDHIFEKHRASCFFDTTLHTKLRMLGMQMLIICGVTTNYCVESTIRDAYFRDYDLLVMEDCVAGSFPDLHEATLKSTRIYFGRVTNLEELGASLGALSATG